MSTVTILLPAQMRKHVERNVTGETKGQRELIAACKALNLGKSNNSCDIELTQPALGAVLDLARAWRNSSNGNELSAGASILKRGELLYRPEDPREIRHEVKMPRSLSQYLTNDVAWLKRNKNAPESLLSDLLGMSWTSTGATGRIRNEALGWMLVKCQALTDHDHSAVQRSSKKFIDTYRELFEKTQRLTNGYLGTDDDEDQEQEEPAAVEVEQEESDEDQAPEVTLTKMRLSHLIVWEDRDFYFWYGGTAKGKAQPQTPMLVSINWHESKNGTNFIRSAETREIVAEAHSMSNVWAAHAREENKARHEAAQAAQVEEPVAVEETEPEPAPEPTPALKPKGRPVPQNWLDMCEEADTESARAWWRGYCDRYRRGEV
jgi:hypothetical protein